MRSLVGILLLVALLGGCGDGDRVQGIVIGVEGDLTTVESFVLRGDDGEVLTIVPAEDGDFGFPLPHLNEHRSSLSPIVVTLDREFEPPRAIAIHDAGSPTWHE